MRLKHLQPRSAPRSAGLYSRTTPLITWHLRSTRLSSHRTVCRAADPERLARQSRTLVIAGAPVHRAGSFSDCVHAIVPTLLGDLPLGGKTKKECAALVKKCLDRWSPLLARFVQSNTEQACLLKAVGQLAAPVAGSVALFEVFTNILKVLYDLDVLTEDAILTWADGAEGTSQGSAAAILRAQAAGLVNWLREADESSASSASS